MAKMMIYHAIIGAMLMTGANREKVWGGGYACQDH